MGNHIWTTDTPESAALEKFLASKKIVAKKCSALDWDGSTYDSRNELLFQLFSEEGMTIHVVYGKGSVWKVDSTTESDEVWDMVSEKLNDDQPILVVGEDEVFVGFGKKVEMAILTAVEAADEEDSAGEAPDGFSVAMLEKLYRLELPDDYRRFIETGEHLARKQQRIEFDEYTTYAIDFDDLNALEHATGILKGKRNKDTRGRPHTIDKKRTIPIATITDVFGDPRDVFWALNVDRGDVVVFDPDALAYNPLAKSLAKFLALLQPAKTPKTSKLPPNLQEKIAAGMAHIEKVKKAKKKT